MEYDRATMDVYLLFVHVFGGELFVCARGNDLPDKAIGRDRTNVGNPRYIGNEAGNI